MMMRRWCYVIIIWLLGFTSAIEELTIHLVPHTHVDVAFDESSESVYENVVEKTLNKILEMLVGDEQRRFVWSEVFFFKKWYENLQQLEKERVKMVVERGQLEFVSGGLVEFEESVNRLEDILAQVSIGHRWLEHHFGYTPRVGWHMGNYGHSSSTPSICAALNLDALVISGLHFQMLEQLKSEKHLEFMWESTEIVRSKSEIFTHVLGHGYTSPEGFDFESAAGVRPVSNAKRRAERLLHQLRERASVYKTQHLLVPLGDNNRFIQADKQFTNMEKIMQYMREKMPTITIKFSTPSEYFEAIRETATVTGLAFPKYSGDFLPYADTRATYWTGMYSSRMALKDASRLFQNLVRNTETLFAIARTRVDALGVVPIIQSATNEHVTPGSEDAEMDFDKAMYTKLEHIQGIAGLSTDHHNIGGTSLNAVVSNMLAKFRQGEIEAHDLLVASVAQLLTKRQVEIGAKGVLVAPRLTAEPFDLENYNIETATKRQHPVIVYNTDGIAGVKIVDIFVGMNWEKLQYLHVTDDDGKAVRAQLSRHMVGSLSNPAFKVKLTFVAEVPPLGIRTYFVSVNSVRDRVKQSQHFAIDAPVTHISDPSHVLQQEAGLEMITNITEKVLKFENSLLKVDFDMTTGLLTSITNKMTQRVTSVKQSYVKYTGSKSGARVFLPTNAPIPVNMGNALLIWSRGTLFDYLQVVAPGGIGHEFRLWKHEELEEFLDTVLVAGAEPNVETAVQFETDMISHAEFYTDDPSGSLIKRMTADGAVQKYTYPATSTVALRDADKAPGQAQVFAFLSRVPFAANSPQKEGTRSTIQMMLHRNFEKSDDKMGVTESLSDFAVTKVHSMLVLGTPNRISSRLPLWRKMIQNPVSPLFARETPDVSQLLTRANWVSHFHTKYSLLVPTWGDVRTSIMSLRPRAVYSSDVTMCVRYLGDGGNIDMTWNAMFENETTMQAFRVCAVNGGEVLSPRWNWRTSVSGHVGIERMFPVKMNPKNTDTELSPGEVQCYILDWRVMKDADLPASMYGADNPHISSDTGNDNSSIDSGTYENLASMTQEQIEGALAEQQEHISALQRRVDMYNSNIDNLLREISKFEKSHKQLSRDVAVKDLRLAEDMLQETKKSIEESNALIERYSKYLTIRFEVDHDSSILKSPFDTREQEAAVHGAVAGAGVMLLIVIAISWIRSGLRMRKGYVPVTWGTQGAGTMLLPVHKSH